MSWGNAAVAEFLRGLGLDRPVDADAAVLSVAFERRGTLYIEPEDDGLRLSAARPLPAFRDGMLGRALALCHPVHRRPFAVTAGLSGDSLLVFLVHVAEREVTVPVLEAAIDTLFELHDRVAA